MDVSQFARQALDAWPFVLLQDALRYFLFVLPAFLIVRVWKSREWEHRRIQAKPVKREQFWMEFRYSVSTIVIFSFVGTGIFMAKKAGFMAIYDEVREYGLMYFLLSPLILILLHDAYFYWSHRLLHIKTVFRHAHLVHHRSTSPSPWAAYSFHPLEALVQAAFYPVTLALLPFHPAALFVFITYMIARNVWGHLGYELAPRWFTRSPWLNWNTVTTHHDLHHATSKTNFGLYFTWWDRWMETEHPRYRELVVELTGRHRAETRDHGSLTLETESGANQ